MQYNRYLKCIKIYGSFSKNCILKAISELLLFWCNCIHERHCILANLVNKNSIYFSGNKCKFIKFPLFSRIAWRWLSSTLFLWKLCHSGNIDKPKQVLSIWETASNLSIVSKKAKSEVTFGFWSKIVFYKKMSDSYTYQRAVY